VTGTESTVVNRLPWLFVVAALGGLGYAWWLRVARPRRYVRLAAAHTWDRPVEEEQARDREPVLSDSARR